MPEGGNESNDVTSYADFILFLFIPENRNEGDIWGDIDIN